MAEMARPLHLTEVDGEPDVAEAERGCRALGFEPNETQRTMWRVVQAVDEDGLPAHPEDVVEVPRRAGKTEGILSVLVGRCLNRPGHVAVYCAQTGLKSRERFHHVVRRLGRGPEADWESKGGKGEERVEFGNGAVLHFWPPKPDRFRGDEIHTIVFDEAQEVDPEDGAELVGAAMPTFDTVPEAQLVVAGTAGKQRSGLLWESLEKGRAGEWAIVEYAAPDLDLDDVVDDEDVWVATHPGPATNPTPERVVQLLRKRRKSMSREDFAREYLSLWPRSVEDERAFTLDEWEAAGAEHAPRPPRYAVAFDVTPSRDSAAIVCAYVGPDGEERVEVLHTRAGVSWLKVELMRLWRLTHIPIGYDAAVGSGNLDIADMLKLARNAPDLKGLTTAEYVSSCTAFAQGVKDGTVRHPRQDDLTAAVEVAKRRRIGDVGWAWQRSTSEGSIAPLVAATVALRVLHENPAMDRPRVVTARR